MDMSKQVKTKEKNEERKKLQKSLAQKENMIANAVKNLIQQGMSPQQVAQILQLDVEEVRKLFLILRKI
jgi:DNA-binding CsgD family transcriptional regulator